MKERKKKEKEKEKKRYIKFTTNKTTDFTPIFKNRYINSIKLKFAHIFCYWFRNLNNT